MGECNYTVLTWAAININTCSGIISSAVIFFLWQLGYTQEWLTNQKLINLYIHVSVKNRIQAVYYFKKYSLTLIYDWCKETDNKELCNHGNKWHHSYIYSICHIQICVFR